MINWEFFPAVCKGDVAALKLMIEQGQDVNVLFKTGSFSEAMTPLNAALNKRQTDAALFLIEAGADVDKKDGFGDPPLLEAIYRSNDAVVRKLLEKGANPNGYNDGTHNSKNRQTALGAAWKYERYDIAVELIAAGARPVIWEEQGKERPVLLLAIERGLLDLAERMIKSGADGAVMNERGEKASVILAQQATIRARGSWDKTSVDEVSRTKEELAFKRTLKDVFNFRTRERVSAFVDPSSGKVEAMAVTSFDDMKDKTLLEEALEEFQKQGGVADSSVLRGPVLRRDKRPLLPERK